MNEEEIRFDELDELAVWATQQDKDVRVAIGWYVTHRIKKLTEQEIEDVS